MAFAVVQEPTRDIPALTLSVDHSSSSSPFPSPGSGFLPPPKLGAHEFASRHSPVDQVLRTIGTGTKRRSHDEMNGTSKPQSLNGATTPTVASALASPVTPTPASFGSPPTQVTIPDPQDATLVTPTEKPSQRESLSSSRPAPPSPAVSRRTSSALSARARSRPQSRVTSLSQPQPPQETAGPSTAKQQQQQPVVVLKIRDYAYPADDARHAGRGPDVPRANRARNRGSVYSTASSSSAASDDGEEAADPRQSGFGAFRWNTLSAHFWGGREPEGDDGAGPSQVDFGRNFEQADDDEDEDEAAYEDAEEDEYDRQPADDEPLVPGTYRALYPFEPEGTAEMALDEDQVVHVVGRGGGVGWAIVEKQGGGHALVPESYLELVQADEPSSPT